MVLLKFSSDTSTCFVSQFDLRLSQSFNVTVSSRIGASNFLVIIFLASKRNFFIMIILISKLHKLLPNLSYILTPILKLLLVQFVDAEMISIVIFLPLDWIKMDMQSRQ